MTKSGKIVTGSLIILFMLACIVFMLCGREILPQAIEDVSDEIYYRNIVRRLTPAAEEGDELVSSEILLKEGIAGWLTIDGTKIDYPVMQEDVDRTGYYLCHRADGKSNRNGSLYIPSYDSACSDNIIIYGHHAHNGTMFAGLSSYRDGKWARDHRTVGFVSEEGAGVYEVIAVIVESMENRSFKWEEKISFTDDNSSQEYQKECISRSVTDMGCAPNDKGSDNRYLTLVTCDYSVPDGRLIVVCRRV